MIMIMIIMLLKMMCPVTKRQPPDIAFISIFSGVLILVTKPHHPP
jgi:hypothetical protein